ncbi:MAG TPA: DUF5615 family PIN-like protein [Myxococcales bacterium]|nr:DUF5615 family PIN-like protein [Myxococcales bacterium]
MKVIADINISVRVVAALQERGHDIVRADAYVPPTATDAEIAELAATHGALVLTRDQDFAALLAMSRARAPSLINLRHQRTDAAFLVELLDGILRRHTDVLLAGAILTVDERGVRVHGLPIGSPT